MVALLLDDARSLDELLLGEHAVGRVDREPDDAVDGVVLVTQRRVPGLEEHARRRLVQGPQRLAAEGSQHMTMSLRPARGLEIVHADALPGLAADELQALAV